MGGKLEVTAAANQTTFATDVFSESATRAMALVADVVRNPAFPETDLARVRNDAARNLSIQRSQPAHIGGEAIGRFDAAAMEATIRRTLGDWNEGLLARRPEVDVDGL
ncbi:MAG TPA: insulinase family protein [Thermoanaerobaculia bacterium]|nr:insulinase family protein [Thermoanaerobaculia bacterium]